MWWKGSEMVKEDGWLLGEFGGAIGRGMKARKGVGLLEKEEEGLLWISEGKGEGFGWGRLWNWWPLSGMPRTPWTLSASRKSGTRPRSTQVALYHSLLIALACSGRGANILVLFQKQILTFATTSGGWKPHQRLHTARASIWVATTPHLVSAMNSRRY